MSSLQERVAQRRRQREKERTFILPVRGYEDVGLYARYQVLSYEELRDIATGDEDDVIQYADSLIAACLELLEKDGDDYRSLGCRWASSPNVLRDKLGLDVPDGATSREALLLVFNGKGGTGDLVMHARAWDEEASKTVAEIDEEQAGEPLPSVEGSSRLQPMPLPEGSPSMLGSSTPVEILTS